MKKLLALILSLLMAFSCMTCLFTSSVSAAEATDITWQSPASWVGFAKIDGEGAVDGPVVQVESPNYQAIYTRLNLDANTNYILTMYVKNLALTGYQQFTVASSLGSDALDFAKLSGAWADYKPASHLADGAVVAYNSYFKDLGATEVTGADGETWSKINVNFTTSDATQYILVMNSFSLVDSSNNNVYISDLAFEKKILGDWAPGRSITISTTESDGTAIVPYQNGPAYKIQTYPCNQSIYTTAKLEPSTSYVFTAYFKGNYIPAVGYNAGGNATDGKGETWVISTKAGFDDCHMNNGSVVSTGWFEYYDDDGYENLYKHNAYRDSYTDNNTWRKYSFSFTTGTDTDYYIVLGLEAAYSGGDADPRTMYMSDVSVKKNIGMSAVAEGNGTVAVSNSTPDEGEEVTFTAKPYAGCEFLGWYNGDTKVSDSLVYTVTADKALTLTAKFKGELLEWKSPTGWANVTQVDGTPAVNGPLLKVNAQFQAIYARVTLKPNTNYTYTMYTKGIVLTGYPQFTIATSLGSDALDFAKLSGTWTEYKPTSHLADGAAVIYNSYYLNLNVEEVEASDFSHWQKITVNFTTTAADEYIVVMNSLPPENASEPASFMSDAAFAENISMTATSEGNGSAKVSNAAPVKGEQVTFTATTIGDSEFLGWYNGDVKVSNDLVYTLTATESLNLVAKFLGGATAVDGWVCPRDPNGWISTTTEIAPKAGGTVYKTGNWPCDRSIYTKLTLKPGTKYIFSAYFMGAVAPAIRNNADPYQPTLYQDGKGNESWVISANADITKGNAGSSTGISDWNEFTGNGTYTNLNNGDVSLDAWDANNKFTTWRKYTMTFTTEEDDEYYIILGLEGDSSKQTGQSGGYPTYMSDACIIEVGDAVAEVTDYTENLGSSLRKESESAYGQAIRHKFTLNKSVFAADYDGYKLVEIGFATAVTANLEGHANIPVLNASSYNVLVGVAYKADYSGNVSKNIMFAEDDTTVTYTAALYNISDYAKSYTVVPYVIYENAEGAQVTRYGEGQTASIFDVAKAILDGNNDDDKAYVNNTLLAGDYKAQYDEWLAN